MIPKENLDIGKFYDGFYFFKGTQKGTMTCMWDGFDFIEPNHCHFIPLRDPEGIQHESFEPNVISTGEPAS